MANIPCLLLEALLNLGDKNFKILQWHFINGVEGFNCIPRYQLEKADRPDTVDVILQSYGHSKSVEITLNILKKMNQNQVAEDLSSKLRKSNGDYGLLTKQCNTTVQQIDKKMPHTFLFIAIHFGTSYTGYCFKFKGTSHIQIPRWGEEHGLDTCKTPTCSLFNKTEEFMRFGYDALKTYTRYTKESKAKEMYLFENFITQLDNKEVHRDLMFTAENGKQMKAMKVLSESLKYFKGHALEKIGEYTQELTCLPSDATWVLTVPALWSAAATQFMREAATEAGLVTESDSERVIMCQEPEAASVFCKQLPREPLEQVPGTKFMVLGCGGSAIDITMHENLEGGRLKEIHSISRIHMGGQCVDRNFKTFLREIFSEEIFDEYENEYPSELQSLMYDFTNYKCFDGDVLIPCPYNLLALAQKKQDMSAYFKIQQGAEWDEGSIKLSRSKLRSFYNDILRAMHIKIDEILNNLKYNIDYIFLVGGFASSKILSSFVKQQFGSTCKVICPCEAQTAVMQGAVMFGTMPNVITSRISLYTYGISEIVNFNESKHKGKAKCIDSDGTEYCNVCFRCLVKKGESVLFDEVRSFTYSPVDRNQTQMQFDFYKTDKLNAMFVDEWGMNKIGSFLVAMPNIKRAKGRSVRLDVRFGSTEIQATAVDVDSGETSSVKLDFIT